MSPMNIVSSKPLVLHGKIRYKRRSRTARVRQLRASVSLCPILDYTVGSMQLITALVREASLPKSETARLRSIGIEIRIGDVTDGVDQLESTFEGVDIVISALVD
ncbi:hypothetical protein BD310DRAFT_260992 [Dichomitus squalens]|uniref:NmrA-like domain-containing protein n=1 Tax=Dichomitus squalens TaxID=114155 RepID=A0A4Q9PGD5_9APHY|nr:hypothetical protein BD310DRAFT_260992 [Dichomitus squalens]